MSVPERRAMVERPSENLSVRRQCVLLNLARSGVYTSLELAILCGSAFTVAISHFVIYTVIVRHREFEYLRSSAIGVDIDGVLNKHREKFCEMLKAKLGKSIQPDQIKVLPQHLMNAYRLQLHFLPAFSQAQRGQQLLELPAKPVDCILTGPQMPQLGTRSNP
jgi:hypothetical protein